jgi:hypothetical protein
MTREYGFGALLSSYPIDKIGNFWLLLIEWDV